MSKEKPIDPERAARKAEKRAKKESKRTETDGVHKSSKKAKTSKDETPIDLDAENIQTTTQLLNALEAENPGTVVVKEDSGDLEIQVKNRGLIGALVPFAQPLADEKVGKKVLKSVKKANAHGSLKRGVKEVVKAVRKSPIPSPSSSDPPSLICVLAADISPMDVISHLPVLCEDHAIPYIFVTSRAELGAAGSTKRPTSVVLVERQTGKKKRKAKDEAEGKKEKEEDWGEIFEDLVKIVQKASGGVRI